jgi:hypothetical protein
MGFVRIFVQEKYQNLVVIITTLFISVIIMHVVEIPLSKLRQSYKKIQPANKTPLLYAGGNGVLPAASHA